MSMMIQSGRFAVASGSGYLRWRARFPLTWATGATNIIGATEIEMFDVLGGTDITTGQTASASLVESGTAANNAIDNTALQWTTGVVPSAGGHWLEVAFSSATMIEQITFWNRNDSFFLEAPKTVIVEYFDGSTWVEYWRVENIPTWARSTRRRFTNPSKFESKSIWRINVTAKQNGSSWLTLENIELRSAAGGADLTTPDGPIDASHNPEIVKNLIDTSSSTVWNTSSPTLPFWISYDIGKATNVMQLLIRNQAAGDSPTVFDVQYWNPATSAWVTDWSINPSGTWVANETKIFTKP